MKKRTLLSGIQLWNLKCRFGNRAAAFATETQAPVRKNISAYFRIAKEQQRCSLLYNLRRRILHALHHARSHNTLAALLY